MKHLHVTLATRIDSRQAQKKLNEKFHAILYPITCIYIADEAGCGFYCNYV